MLPICYVCLRSNVELRTLDDQMDLLHFYDELCDYNFQDFFYQFCEECISNLKNCYGFRKQCQTANDVLKAWRKTKMTKRASVHDLYKEMPVSNLNFTNNCKMCFCQQDLTPPVQSISPNIANVDIPKEDNLDEEYIKQEIPVEVIKPVEENVIMFKAHNENPDYKVKIEFSDDDNRDAADDKDDKYDSDSDKSMKELLSKLRKRKAMCGETENEFVDVDQKRKERKRDIRKIRAKTNAKIKLSEQEQFKTVLREKFMNDVVKDEKGNVIDVQKIINSIYKMPLSYVQKCRRAIRDGPITPLEIKKLAQIYTHFVEFASVFDVEYLTDNTQAQAEFSRRHEYPDYVKAQFRCEDCFSGFKSRKSLDFHRRVLHNPLLPLSCELCKMRFNNRKQMSWHFTKLHKAVYRCKKCPFIINDRDMMENHFRRHEGLKYTCEHCPEIEFNLKNQYYLHMSKHHKQDKGPFIYCEFCAFSTYSLSGLVLHKNRLHSGEKFVANDQNRKCEECDAVFVSEDVYDKHVRITHTNITEVAYEKKYYPKRVRKPISFSCRLCDNRGSSPGWLMKHFREAHPTESVELVYRDKKKHLCDECGKGFNLKCFLSDHMNTHTGVKPYSCEQCPATFHTRLRLYKHKERHLPPIQCDICGKGFKSKSNLNNHKLIHKGDRNHKCDQCGKGFISTSSLKEHIRGVHLNIRRKRKGDIEQYIRSIE